MVPFLSGPKASIHRQIVLIALTPALVIALLLVFVIYQNNLRISLYQLQQQGQLLAAQLAGALEYPLAIGASEQLSAVVESAIKPAAAIMGTPVQAVTVLDAEGRALYEFSAADPPPKSTRKTGPSPRPAEAATVFSMPVALQTVGLKEAALPEPRIMGYVKVQLSLLTAQTRWQQRLLEELGFVILLFGIISGFAYKIGRHLSNTIREIADAIQAIKNGQLAIRLPQTAAHELGTLQEGVNLLADTLERGRAQLETELTKVRGEYQTALQKLEEANQAKSFFLARISHEMRTPMYSVLGLLEQLLKLDREPDEKRTLKMIKEAAATVNRHIDDILDVTQLARLEKKGKRLPSNEPVNLWGILETVAAMQQPLMNTRDLYLDIIVTPQVPTVVKSNIKAFREIVSNLLGNAVKYTQHGGITVWFETVERARPTLRLRVADSGCGIPEDRLDSIFREFEQVDEAYNRRHGGTGLGLSFVKKNCSLLGGHVTVASALERGSTFTVELPIHPADDVPSGRGADSARLLGNRRGLVADERSTFRASVISRFQSLRIAIEEQAIDLTALAAARPPGLFYDLLIVQNLRKQPEKMLPDLIRGLRPWANLLIDFETEYNVEIQRFLQGAGVGIVFWSGARRADLEAALLVATQQKISERAGLLAPLAPTSGLLAGRKILVVEDYEINRAIMMKQLYENGASVLEAEDGDTAVMLAAEPGLDLILMDIQMPGKDGITAIQEIRHLSSGAHLPILGFTASVDEPTLNRILNAGADGVLNKPISESDLIKGVRQAIQKVASRSWRPAH